MTGIVKILSAQPIGPFEFRWPDATEAFKGGWMLDARIGRVRHKIRHGIGARPVYGYERVHAVTWVDGAVQVEGVQADDYRTSQALISRILREDRKTARTLEQVPPGYEGLDIVEHRTEIDAPHSPYCLAVKIREDDVASWALHAWLRSQLPPRKRQLTVKPARLSPPAQPPPQATNAQAVGRALLAHADSLAEQSLTGPLARFTPFEDADRLVREDPFAFLLAVISDMGIPAERAWALPYHLRNRLGFLTPRELAADPASVRAAVQQEPKLHRFVNHVSDWLVQAAQIVLDRYEGDASRIWSDRPTATVVRQRLESFPGVGQKKAAMAAEILSRTLGVPIRGMDGSDIAYDVHVRRVFLRTGLASSQAVEHGLPDAASPAHRPRPPPPGPSLNADTSSVHSRDQSHAVDWYYDPTVPLAGLDLSERQRPR